MSSRYSVETAVLEQCREQTKSLWVGNLRSCSVAEAEAKLDLGYQANPAGPGAIIILRIEPDAQIVGVQGVHQRSFHLGPLQLRTANLADFAVSAEHRTLGPALMLMKYAMASTSAQLDLLYGLPNAKSAAVCKRAGLRVVGSVKRLAKPLRSGAWLARHLHPRVAPLLASLVDRVLQARDAIHDRFSTTRLALRAARFDDPDIDAIWARRDRNLLLAERSAAMLHWRYGLPGRGDWQLVIASQRDGTPVGYVAWSLRAGVASVSDFFCTDPHAHTTALMLAFSRHARQHGASVISLLFHGLDAVGQGLQRAGFALRDDNTLVFLGQAPAAVAALDPQTGWYTTGFDNDAD